MPTTDLIFVLESLGYTSREAAFLYLVAVHSGYFLRRQFDYFIDRQKGAISQNLIEKARVAGHVAVLDYKQGRHVYHLFFRPIYRLLGNPDSQNRRRKGDASIRARLMALDYVLENLDDHHLESAEEKARFLSEARRVTPETFLDSEGKLLFPLNAALISIADRTRPATSLVRFVFVDEGLLTTTRFARFLRAAKPLLTSLSNAEVIYVAGSRRNFATAQYVFDHCFPRLPQYRQSALDPDWGEEAYSQRPPSPEIAPQSRPAFSTLLVHYSYPPIQRKESASLRRSRPQGLSQTLQVSELKANTNTRGLSSG